MKRIETLLSREIGLSLRSIGKNALVSAVSTRMSARRLHDGEQYADVLSADADERRALVEEIVVSETWFFRDDEVFRTLARHASGPFRTAHPRRSLRVLSLPCATGEEAYSVAMLLFEQGFAASEFEVFAVDVSERALRAAERASYGKNSFRGGGADARMHYFEAAGGDELRPVREVRDRVSFARGNVLDPNPLWERAPFDVILCRNLLIYLDREARVRALENLKRWLAPDGLLFAGHAETLDTMDADIQRLDRASNFAYVKRREPRAPASTAASGKPLAIASKATWSLHETEAVRARRAKTRPRQRPPVVPASPAADAKTVHGEADLESARELANRGRLAEAAGICERHLAADGPSANAYCLLGIVRKASDEPSEAMECFDKALYLDPAHYEALVHLALLHEQRGDRARAGNLRRRAERALAGKAGR